MEHTSRVVPESKFQQDFGNIAHIDGCSVFVVKEQDLLTLSQSLRHSLNVALRTGQISPVG
jgi:hypothetical protein